MGSQAKKKEKKELQIDFVFGVKYLKSFMHGYFMVYNLKLYNIIIDQTSCVIL